LLISRRPFIPSLAADDEQALTIHVPHILKTQGIAAARAMHAKLTGAKPQLVEKENG
jgi:hypothetical protein